MRRALEAMSTSRLLDRLRGWSLHHADAVMARADRVEPEAVVVDRDRSLHRWPMPGGWLAGDAAGGGSLGALPERMRSVGGVAFALTMPAWIAPDGSIWVFQPDDEESGELEEVVLVEIADRHVRELHVGCVHHRPAGGVGPWDRVRLGERDPMLGWLGRALG